jgi:hypothetical protein
MGHGEDGLNEDKTRTEEAGETNTRKEENLGTSLKSIF